MKSIPTINPAITENTECLIVKVCALFIDLKVSVLLDHGVSLCFVLLLALRICWTTFQVKNNKRSGPASSELVLALHRSLYIYVTHVL